MKKTKIISIVLAIVMLISIMSICVSATDTSYSGFCNYFVTGENILKPEDFEVVITVDDSNILALDGESPKYTLNIVDITTSDGISYYTNEQEFFEVFASETYEGAPINIDFTITFDSDKCFGKLNYTVDIKGFSAPLSLGLGGLDDALSGVLLPAELQTKGNIPEFPSVDVSSIEVTSRPIKDTYYDNEKYDATGLAVNCALTNGQTGSVVYSEDTAYVFDFNPSASEKLSVLDTEVAIFLDGAPILYAPIQVSHKYSGNYVSITTDVYSENKPGYHAFVCDGCGEACDAQPHNPSPVLDENGEPLVDEEGEFICWTSNNDQTFLKNGTESSICQDCGAVLTRNTFGTADYNETLANYHFIRVILDYVNALLRIINGAF